jgi:hypothetical protein
MLLPKDPLLFELEDELHDLCQPLTALQFRLELGKFVGDSEALLEAVDGALEETSRMIESIKRMRERISDSPGRPAQPDQDSDGAGAGAAQHPQNKADGVSNTWKRVS